jgi:glucan phosphoethanolaminetransferase (alkaline phosphatase superfamily)
MLETDNRNEEGLLMALEEFNQSFERNYQRLIGLLVLPLVLLGIAMWVFELMGEMFLMSTAAIMFLVYAAIASHYIRKHGKIVYS